MKRSIFIISILFLCTFTNFAANLNSMIYKAVDVATCGIEIPASSNNQNFNLVFSAILPEGGVYVAIDDITGAEAIVQIGYSQLESDGDKLFFSSNIFSHFVSKYDIQPNEIKVKMKFIGWNKSQKDMNTLSLDRLIVTPNISMEEMKKYDDNKYYIQLGSYHFYQNSYPRILEMLPMMDSYPKFFILRRTMNRNDKNIDIYRVLSGPFEYDEAKTLAEQINSKCENKVFIQSQKKLVNEDCNEVIYDEKK